jgi:hypothetical protein
MKKPAVWIGLIFLIAFIAMMYHSTTGLAAYRVEVCVTFRGNEACRTASARTKEEAQRTAQSNACAQVASGMSDSMGCERGGATKVTWLPVN